jgi:hypothetical protein
MDTPKQQFFIAKPSSPNTKKTTLLNHLLDYVILLFPAIHHIHQQKTSQKSYFHQNIIHNHEKNIDIHKIMIQHICNKNST